MEIILKVNIKDGQNLWDALNDIGINIERPCGGHGKCNGCKVLADGKMVNSCEFSIPGMHEIEIPQKMHFDGIIGDFFSVNEFVANPVVIVDIGTTIVALKLLYKDKNYETSFVNPQRKYGADVMSRIENAGKSSGYDMTILIRDALSAAVNELSDEAKRNDKNFEIPNRFEMYVAANTTMLHLFRNLDVSGLGQYPFKPVTLKCEWENMIFTIKNKKIISKVTFLPGISTYVGADIVSGIYGVNMANQEKISLMIDLGTNAEMALGNKNRILVASAAAGPAFEGSRLSEQIYASGIMKLLNNMLKKGIIDEYGTLDDEYFSVGYPVDDSLELTDKSGDLRITQDEIRQIQMAKAAIASGINILLKEYDISAQDVDVVYLSGGMGHYLNPDDAKGISLLPNELSGNIISVGNSSLGGLMKLISQKETALEEIDRISDISEEILLAQYPGFQEIYIENMNF